MWFSLSLCRLLAFNRKVGACVMITLAWVNDSGAKKNVGLRIGDMHPKKQQLGTVRSGLGNPIYDWQIPQTRTLVFDMSLFVLDNGPSKSLI